MQHLGGGLGDVQKVFRGSQQPSSQRLSSSRPPEREEEGCWERGWGSQQNRVSNSEEPPWAVASRL